ncbi:MAG TPA: hypothetical protein VNS10_04855 [Gemmatimonadaceae bacterium]|jgi:hypothetical protein|nr:hypothetical protein [Gemmatimonadaceae bacterium]
MTSLASLWLPILLSAVFVFVMSSLLHMVLPWHRTDYSKVPNEDAVSAALRGFSIPPGDYMMPRPDTRAEMASPEFAEKVKKGPMVVMTVMPAGMSMAGNLAQWFGFLVVVSLFAAYITSRTVGAGAASMRVVQLAAATAFVAYGVGLWPMSIWYRRSWGTTFKSTVDGLIYGLITGATLAWLWPK